jgi:hypothetical protein
MHATAQAGHAADMLARASLEEEKQAVVEALEQQLDRQLEAERQLVSSFECEREAGRDTSAAVAVKSVLSTPTLLSLRRRSRLFFCWRFRVPLVYQCLSLVWPCFVPLSFGPLLYPSFVQFGYQCMRPFSKGQTYQNLSGLGEFEWEIGIATSTLCDVRLDEATRNAERLQTELVSTCATFHVGCKPLPTPGSAAATTQPSTAVAASSIPRWQNCHSASPSSPFLSFHFPTFLSFPGQHVQRHSHTSRSKRQL